MNILFFGVGGVGGYFGALVTEHFSVMHDIYFIARGEHKEAIVQNGLTLKKSGGEEIIHARPKLCTASMADVPRCNLIVVSVKGYDLDNAVEAITPKCSENTIILPLLNGVDIYNRIRRRLKTGIILPACVYVGTHIESPGIIFQKGGSCNILFGKDPNRPEADLQLLYDIFEKAGVRHSLEDKVESAIWSKYMFIAPYGLVTAVYNKTIGEVYQDTDLSNIVKEIMQEIFVIAKQKNVVLPDDIVDKSFVKAEQFPFETKTSFQRDVEKNNGRFEGDLFGGTVLRFGKELNIPTPVTEMVYQKLL